MMNNWVWLLLLFGFIALLQTAYFVHKKIIRKEKIQTFSFLMGLIIEKAPFNFSSLTDDSDWIIKRLGQINGSFDKEKLSPLIKAAIFLRQIRLSISNGATLLDVSGENVRSLGIQVAGIGNQSAQNLVDATVSFFNDGGKLEEASTLIDDFSVLNEQDVLSAQLILERQIAALYKNIIV